MTIRYKVNDAWMNGEVVNGLCLTPFAIQQATEMLHGTYVFRKAVHDGGEYPIAWCVGVVSVEDGIVYVDAIEPIPSSASPSIDCIVESRGFSQFTERVVEKIISISALTLDGVGGGSFEAVQKKE